MSKYLVPIISLLFYLSISIFGDIKPIPPSYWGYYNVPIVSVPEPFMNANRGDTIVVTYSIVAEGSMIAGTYPVLESCGDSYKLVDTTLKARNMEDFFSVKEFDKYLHKSFEAISEVVEYDSGVTLLLQRASEDSVESFKRFISFENSYPITMGIGDLSIALVDFPEYPDNCYDHPQPLAYSYFWGKDAKMGQHSNKSFTIEVSTETSYFLDDKPDYRAGDISLQHMLTHELVHLIAGAKHVNNPSSVIYPLIEPRMPYCTLFPNSLRDQYEVRALLRRVFREH